MNVPALDITGRSSLARLHRRGLGRFSDAGVVHGTVRLVVNCRVVSIGYALGADDE